MILCELTLITTSLPELLNFAGRGMRLVGIFSCQGLDSETGFRVGFNLAMSSAIMILSMTLLRAWGKTGGNKAIGLFGGDEEDSAILEDSAVSEDSAILKAKEGKLRLGKCKYTNDYAVVELRE